MYSYRYINRLAQFGCVTYTLLIENLVDQSAEPYRVEKKFRVCADSVDSEFLHKEAKKEIAVMLSTPAPQPIPIEVAE